MKVMITGANGFLGQHLCRFLKNHYQVFAVGKGEKRLPFADVRYFSADIKDQKLIGLVTEVNPDIIIHTAAMSKPDECDRNKKLCDEVNVTGTGMIVTAAKQLTIAPHLIYTSSDFVLGEGGPHDETAIPSPLNYYGESKLRAEKMVMDSHLPNTVVRPVFMYGEAWQGVRQTFLHGVKQNLEEGRPIKLVNDQRRTPTYIVDICRGIKAIMEKKAGGLYHLAGEERMTPYEMAVRLAAHLSLDESLIEPVTGETFKEPVRRAKEGGLLIGKAKKDLDYKPVGFVEGLNQSFPVSSS
jgi:dTDP-4-dehydrorhamnose reductase